MSVNPIYFRGIYNSTLPIVYDRQSRIVPNPQNYFVKGDTKQFPHVESDWSFGEGVYLPKVEERQVRVDLANDFYSGRLYKK